LHFLCELLFKFMKDDTLIEKGNTLLNLYTVESDAFVGGMGQVFRVHHTGWKVDLAMKQPKKELFRNEKQKAAFIGECDHWIKLGLHPHIVSCYYVREIDGVPSIFAEWMDGGSLKGVIESESLYEGNAMERIVDISIQFARGLKYAHEQGLIHQDVKPDNLLLTSDGRAKILTAKVADFGIANARAIVTEMSDVSSATGDKTIVVKGHAYTPAYCSPEQKAGKALTRRTDIWSWAVSVLEMFMGDRLWMDGTVAGLACDDYFGTERIPIPEAMKDLLRWCFRANEADRPHDFGIVEAELIKIYLTETGRAYPRPESKAASLTADSLNNRALSYIDLGKPEEAEKCWEEAVKTDPNSSASQYNYSIHLWKNARIDDMEAIRRLMLVSTKDTNYYYCLAKLHLARADAESAIECANEAIAKFGKSEDLNKTLTEAQEMMENGLDGRCLNALSRHQYDIKQVGFSKDGRYAFSFDQTYMQRWDVISGECIQTINGIFPPVFFSPDDKKAISLGGFAPKIWNAETGESIRFLKRYQINSRYSCVSPDWLQALSIGNEGKWVTLWDIETGNSIRSFENPYQIQPFNGVEFSPDGEWIYCMYYSSGIHIYNKNTGELLHSFGRYPSHVLDISSDRRFLLMAYGDKGEQSVQVWDILSGECIRTFCRSQTVTHASLNVDNRLVISGGFGGKVQIWEVETGKCIRTFRFNDGVKTVSISLDGKYAIAGGNTGREVKIWRIAKEPEYEKILSRIQSLESATKEKEKFYFLVAEIDHYISEKDIPSALEKLAELRKMTSFISVEAFHDVCGRLALYCTLRHYKDIFLRKNSVISAHVWDFYWKRGNIFAISGNHHTSKGYLTVWNLQNDQCVCTLDKGCIEFTSVVFSPDGKLALCSSGYKNIKLWHIETGKCIYALGEYTVRASSVYFSPNGKQALTGGKDKTAKLWDVDTGKCIRTFKSHNDDIRCVSLSPDGKIALTGSRDRDRTVKVWNVMSGKCIGVLKGSINDYTSICFSADGKMALSGGSSGYLMLWNLSSYECILDLKGHRDYISSLCFSPNNRLAVSGSHDKTMKIWDITTGKCIHTIDSFTDAVLKVSFSPDGRQIAVADKHEAHIYNLDFDLHFPGWQDWDEGARPYMDIFLALHPNWTDEDFNYILIPDLQNRGYGWLRPEGVRRELEKMSYSFWKQLFERK